MKNDGNKPIEKPLDPQGLKNVDRAVQQAVNETGKNPHLARERAMRKFFPFPHM